MKLNESKTELLQLIQDADNRFLSSYQICMRIESQHPKLWNDIQKEYGTAEGNSAMGSGSGQYYSPASYISQALEYFSKSHPQIKKEYLICEDVTFSNIEPGYTGNVVAIWAWQE